MRAQINDVTLHFHDEDEQLHTQPLSDVAEAGPLTNEDAEPMSLVALAIEDEEIVEPETAWILYEDGFMQPVPDLPYAGCHFDEDAGDLEMLRVVISA